MPLDEDVKILSNKLEKLTEEVKNVGKRPENYGRLLPGETALLVCDMQEHYSSVDQWTGVVENTKKLVEACKLLSIPIVVTHKAGKGEGAILGFEKTQKAFDKAGFSMDIDEVAAELEKTSRLTKVILCGVEAHSAILATASDLMQHEKRFEVHVVVDCCSSRSPTDRIYAFRRMEKMGAFLNTTEAVMHDLAMAAGAQHYQEGHPLSLLALLEETAHSTGLALDP